MARHDGTPDFFGGDTGSDGDVTQSDDWSLGGGGHRTRPAVLPPPPDRRSLPRVGAAASWSPPPATPTTQTFTLEVRGAHAVRQAAPPPAPAAPPTAPVRAEAPSAPMTPADDETFPEPGFEFPQPPVAEVRWDIPPVPTGSTLGGADSLTADRIIRSRRAKPETGWRKVIYTMTNGAVNLGPSAADRERNHLISLARTHVTWCHRLAVISLKGGVGKTTTTAALGSVLAELRGDRVIAVDANPDRGTLAERVPRDSGATVRHLLQARHQIQGYGDVRKFTSQAPSRLEVLASDSDPGVSLAYSEQDYCDTVATLERFYNLLLTDCGTGLLHSAMNGILRLADSLVVVSSPSLDGARSASATLDWLEAHGFGELAADAIVVISSVRPGSGMVDIDLLVDHFAARCREVVLIPYDPHLESGGILDLDLLKPATRRAYLELAAVVGDGLTS